MHLFFVMYTCVYCCMSRRACAFLNSVWVCALYDWNYLAATQCVLISPSYVYCYQVSGYGLLVVGHGMVKTVPLLFGGGSET